MNKSLLAGRGGERIGGSLIPFYVESVFFRDDFEFGMNPPIGGLCSWIEIARSSNRLNCFGAYHVAKSEI